jgi:uncharacterized protein YkwD
VVAAAAACGFAEPVTDDVGDAEYCEDVAEWEGDWAELEDELVREVDAVRATGGACGQLEIDADVELDRIPELRCAARRQARDMARQRELTHEGVDATDFPERAHLAGYGGIPRAELLAVAIEDPAEVVARWLASEEHCEVVRDRSNEDAHAGVFETQATRWWVLLFGTRR